MILAWLLPVLHWSIRLWAIWAVPRRRSPNAARAWLLLILVQPIVGVALYSIFGRAYLPARRRDRQEKATRIIEAARDAEGAPAMVDVGDARQATAVLAAKLGGFPVLGGNRAELIDDPDGAIDRLVADIDAARESVHLLFYIFEPDATGRRVTDAVLRAAARGATCRVLMDGMASAPGLKKLAPELRGERRGGDLAPQPGDLPDAARPPQPPQDRRPRRAGRVHRLPEPGRRVRLQGARAHLRGPHGAPGGAGGPAARGHPPHRPGRSRPGRGSMDP